MAGLSYSRTRGRRPHPLSYAALRERFPASAERLPPEARVPYDVHTDPVAMDAYDHRYAYSRPPAFLQFAIEEPAENIVDYPGAALGVSNALPGVIHHDLSEVIEILGLKDGEALGKLLGTFAGTVTLQWLNGIRLYRTVGLMGRIHDLSHTGSAVNDPDGAFWALRSPNSYPTREAFYADTALRLDWNGDYGHLVVDIHPEAYLPVLVGVAGPQLLEHQSTPQYLPGGATQVFIPRIANDDLVEPVFGRPLAKIIVPTRFGTETFDPEDLR